MLKSRLAAVAVGCALALCGTLASAQEQASQCSSVLDAVINFTFECINDSTFLVADSSVEGWQYAEDSDYDGVEGGRLGTKYEIFGMALKETSNEIIIALNSNMPLDGYAVSGAAGGRISHADLFINLTKNDFLTASEANELFAVKYSSNNESGVTELGVYKNAKAKSVTSSNNGFATLLNWKNWVNNLSGLIGFGSLLPDQTYYADSISLNAIESAEYVGAITFLTPKELEDAGFDTTKFAGSDTIAFKFKKDLIIDVCGVVGGDGTSCLDCNNVPCGEAEYDVCEVCGGDGQSCLDCAGTPFGDLLVDQCGICGGDGQSCLDCAGTPFGDLVVDQCGICGGDGTSCLDCDGTVNGDSEYDICGVCGGDGSSCLDCEGNPYGGVVVDQCGICGGNGTSCLDCSGTPFGGLKIDQCGICGGDGTSCLDCAGTPNGSAIVDDCGICGGDGSSCAVECAEVTATKREKSKSRQVKKSAKVLVDRTILFSNEAESCGSADLSKDVRKARKIYQQMVKTLSDDVTNTVTVCNNVLCTEASQKSVKKQLRKQAKQLYTYAKQAKVTAITACHKEHTGATRSKTTEDYLTDLLKAIKKLPNEKLQCD